MSTYEANRYAFPASAITSGTFANARLSSGSVTQHVDLSNLNASNLTSGTVPDARVGSSSVSQHVDLSNLSASNLTSGTIPNARYGTPTFDGSNISNIAAMNTAPTTGSWTPGTSSGTWDTKTGRYQKFGQIVFCQAEMRMTAEPPNNVSEFYFSGLPFSSINITGGYSNNWFVGNGGISYNTQSNAMVQVKANSTYWYIRATGNYAYRATQYFGTSDKGGLTNFNMQGERWLYDTNSDRRWGIVYFYYISAS